MSKMQRARLISTSGINGHTESELRATSSLLAVIGIVRDFSNELVGDLGASRASKATVDTFTEVEIQVSDRKVRPDGLIVVSYGKSTWRALVEVKTGSAKLDAEQLNNYLLAAREVDADLVISISNEIGVAGSHPTEGLKVRSNSRVQVHHYSWSEILAKAVKCKVHAGVSDPEQAWILGELIRYLEHPASGVSDFADMGPSWTEVRDGARQGALTKRTEGVEDIATKWDELLRHLALRLTAETGAEAQQILPRSQRDPKARLQVVKQDLIDNGTMDGLLRIPGTASDLTVTADLKARRITVEATIDAPQDKLGKGSVGWLVRQLTEASDRLLVEAYEKNARTPTAKTLAQIRQDSTIILSDNRADLRKFRVLLHAEAGNNRKSGTRSVGFVDSVNDAVDTFYETVLQNITAWTPPAPKVKKTDHSGEQDQPTTVAPTNLNSEDEPDTVTLDPVDPPSNTASDHNDDHYRVEPTGL